MAHVGEDGAHDGRVSAGGDDQPPGVALELPRDIPIPAPLENQLTLDHASRIQARIVAEGAHGPTTEAAERILLDRGALILPDVYLDAGGVTLSCFE